MSYINNETFGFGTYGIVINRILFEDEDENNKLILNNDQVSKIFFDENNQYVSNNKYQPINPLLFEKEYTDINIIISNNLSIFSDEYFILPINGGRVNKNHLNKILEIFKFKLFFRKTISIYIKIIESLLSYNEKDIYQIIYPKGQRINLNINDFFEKIINVGFAINNSNLNGFFFDDIKLDNLITHNNKIKIIDFTNIINTNLVEEKLIEIIQDSKLCNIYYYPYNSIYNILIYLNIDKLNIIGRKKTEDYHLWLYSIALKHNYYIIYKLKILDNLFDMCNHIIYDYKVDIKVIKANIYNKNDNDNNYEIKSLTIKQIVNSIKNRIIISKIQTKDYNIDEIINNYSKYISELLIKDKLFLLLSKNNLYSFGLILVEWVYKNKNNIISNYNVTGKESYIKYIINIVAMCCLDPLILDNIFYFTSYNFEDVNTYMKNCIDNENSDMFL